MTESWLEYGLAYAALGWPVLPLHWINTKGMCSCANRECKSPGKHPLLKTGVKEASTDPLKINQWFKRWPQANIGIATGATSGILALDIDPRHGGDDSLDGILSKYGRVTDDVILKKSVEFNPAKNFRHKLDKAVSVMSWT